jgi:hypothetical protein
MAKRMQLTINTVQMTPMIAPPQPLLVRTIGASVPSMVGLTRLVATVQDFHALVAKNLKKIAREKKIRKPKTSLVSVRGSGVMMQSKGGGN